MTSTDLRIGQHNEAVRDLQRRLSGAGFDVGDDDSGTFGSGTRDALLAFQVARGLRVDGICGSHTWTMLVEAGRTLGDRLLYLRAPMLRGDDVLALQQRLNALGFDAGREDGIQGPDTTRALTAFQHDAGLAPDGICGPATLDVLGRLGVTSRGSVAALKERDRLRDPGSLQGRSVFVVVDGGLEALGDALDRELREMGAETILEAGDHHDGALAQEARRFGAQVCLVLRVGADPGLVISYFGTGDFRSELGFRIAHRVQEEIPSSLGAARCEPKTYPILRETPMAAVLVELDPTPDRMADVVAITGRLAASIAQGLRRAVEEPAEAD